MLACPQCGYTTTSSYEFCPHDGTSLREKSASLDRWLGQLLESRYRIKRVLGYGGMGVVYLAEHTRIGREVAIKIVNVKGHDASAVHRLEREARAVTLIGHENIVTVYDFGTTSDGSAFLVMEYLTGETLDRRLEREGRLSLESTCNILIQATYAMEAAHGCGVIHRDIKPANIFLCTERGRKDVVKLLDFGIASLQQPISEVDTEESFPSSILGTPGYLAPEQVNWSQADARTDIYTMGITMYEMLSGKSPFHADTLLESVLSVINVDPDPLSKLVKDLPFADHVDDIVQQVLQKHPDARLPSMRAFRSMLVDLRKKLGPPTRRRAEQLLGRACLPRQPIVGWVSTTGTTTRVELAGSLDEHADLERISERIVGPDVELKLSRVVRINSTGHLHWTRWLRALIKEGYRITLHECSPVLINQANMNDAFLQGLEVVSFYAPFYCPQCDLERSVLLKSANVSSRGAGKQGCESCGRAMELDDVEDTYFLFLQSSRKRAQESLRHQKMNLFARVHFRWPGETLRRLHVLTLSQEGAFILAMNPPPVGTSFSLDLHPKGWPPLEQIEVQVVHVRQNPSIPEENGFGVLFRRVADNLREELSELVKKLGLSDMHQVEARSSAEKRKHARVGVHLPAVLRIKGQPLQAEIKNMSMAGALISLRSDAALSQDDRIIIELPSASSAEHIRIHAEVVRFAGADPSTGFAVQFLDLNESTKIVIEELLLGPLTGMAELALG